ncbi:hypothetical protein MXB_3741, partial [Myxobolus squamalis]
MNFVDVEIETFLKTKGKINELQITGTGNRILEMTSVSIIIESLLNYLNSNNSKTRYSIFELIRYLFGKSAAFRSEICPELTKLHRTCLLTDVEGKKLRPVSFTKKLKTLSTKTFIDWYLEYHHVFPQLKILFAMIMRFNPLEARNYYESATKNSNLNIDMEKIEYQQRYAEQKKTIKRDIEVAVSCFTKLVPKFDSISEATNSQSPYQTNSIHSPIKISIKTKKDVFISEYNKKNINLLNVALERCIKFHKPFLAKCYLYFQSEASESVSDLNFLSNKIDQVIS